jgi:transcriptional regulator with XRE-family HTH domain
MTPKKFNKAMGAAIRKEREARGLTMKALGKQLGSSYQQIGKYEHGENSCSAHILVRIAAIFQLSVAELYERARINVAVIPVEPSAAESDGILAGRYVAKIPSGKLRRNIVDFARKCAYEGAAA